MSIREIEKVLDLQLKTVSNNVKILTTKDVGMNYIIRLDKDLMTRKSFYPKIAHSQASSEDRTLPRIVGSPYILGCIIAIPTINPINYAVIDAGFYIHSIEFEYCLKPNSKLVFDAEETNELWLITYNKDTVEYKAKNAGQIVVSSYTIIPTNKKKYQECLMTIFVKVNKEEGLFFNRHIKLEKGYHSVTFKLNETNKRYCETTLDDTKNIEVKGISEQEFEKVKKKQTTLENINLFTNTSSFNKLQQW